MTEKKAKGFAMEQSMASIQRFFGEPAPELLFIAGSGFGDAFPALQNVQRLSYLDIPGFPKTTVPGHHGELLVGDWADDSAAASRHRIAILRGRVHLYEGHSAADIVHPLRTLLRWGCTKVLISNAAGSLHCEWKPGSFMLISDHINATGKNPLIGPANHDGIGPQFLDMSAAYDGAWRNLLKKAAQDLGITLHEGTYLGVTGPSYETPAEVRCFQIWGADAVGMSTVLETIAARQAGARVLGISLLTNIAAGLIADQALDHQEVLAESKKAQGSFRQLFEAVLPQILAGS